MVTQELDGDETDTDEFPPWNVTFEIYPVVDGLSSFTTRETVSENATEADLDVPLNIFLNFNRIDNVDFLPENPREEPIYVEYDLSDLIADAQIQQRLDDLLNITGATLDDLEANGFITGTYTYFAATGRIRVLLADAAGIFLRAALFFQSNEDFTIPVSFLVEDVATINGVDEVRQILYNSSLTVDLVGVADPPTVFVNDASGLSLSRIPLDIGGELTDTDVALGRRE